jgi:hypothetical protein
MTTTGPLKVHITGVYGLIGNLAYQHLAAQPEQYDLYGSGRRVMSSARADADSITRLPDDHFLIADLANATAMEQAIAGMDAVLHIAAVPDPGASFEDVLSSNIVGTYNVLEACRKAGVKRLVYASSIMATWGYFVYQEPYRAIYEGRSADIPAVIPKVKHTDPTHPTQRAKSGPKASAAPTMTSMNSPLSVYGLAASIKRIAPTDRWPKPSGAVIAMCRISSSWPWTPLQHRALTSAMGSRITNSAGWIWNIPGNAWAMCRRMGRNSGSITMGCVPHWGIVADAQVYRYA